MSKSPDIIRIHTSVFSNDGGAVKSAMTFSLGDITRGTKKIYTYCHNIYEIVEIIFTGDTISIIEFVDTVTGAGRVVEEKKDFFAKYFTSAGLVGKRFLFDVGLKLPIRYTDFSEANNISSAKHTMFVTNNRIDGYVTDENNAWYFVCSDTIIAVDNCILSLFSEFRNIAQTKGNKQLFGTMLASIVAGLSKNISIEDVARHMQGVDLQSKFLYNLHGLNNIGEHVTNSQVGLVCTHLNTLIGKTKGDETQEAIFVGEQISLVRLVEIGLNKFLKSIYDPNKKITVSVSLSQINVKSMFIWKGAAFVSLLQGEKIDNIRELLSSEEVYEVTN